jgi:protein-tyrosine-phosphatase
MQEQPGTCWPGTGTRHPEEGTADHGLCTGPHPLREVPDPYFGGDEGFDQVYDMLTEACTNCSNDVRG